jgi:3-hydroxyisobutyrate dehydrogenase
MSWRSTTRVAVVGLGALGSQIVGPAAHNGHDLTVWNRSAVKTEPLVRLGTSAAPSPAEAAGSAKVVLTMVSDPRPLRDVTECGGVVAQVLGSGRGGVR